ncbi:hypothetical protein LCGC14_2540210 [marine sediment metagenome]|uniref:Uncharacterized protein n=1 Tax=marine sediment metagenome TaxID=412755 RepID=A0A0F9DIZ9_9ZZZZ
MATALNLITDAFEEARVYSPGESIPNAKSAAALRKLNRMLESWSNENFLLHFQTEETLTLTAGQASYTIGTSGSPDFNTVRPLEILKGTFIRRTSTLDEPLAVKSFEEYRLRRDKASGSVPWWISYNPTYPNGQLVLWWSPDSAYALHLLSLKALTNFSDLTTTVSLPPGYESAIVYNLGLELGPVYGKKIRPDLVALAARAVRVLKNRNAQRIPPKQLEVGSFTRRHGRSNNINSGPFA